MTPAPLAAPDRLRTSAERVRAVAGSILGNIAILALAGLAVLTVPAAAALTFGSALLERM